MNIQKCTISFGKLYMPSQDEMAKIINKEAAFKAERVREVLSTIASDIDMQVSPVKFPNKDGFILSAKKLDARLPKYVLQADEKNLLHQARRLLKQFKV